MEQYKWLANKTINYDYLCEELYDSQRNNHFANFGPANNQLQKIARKKLKINEDYDIIACSSGTAAYHAIIFTLQIVSEKNLRVANQAFTFPSSAQGPASGSLFVDLDDEFSFDLTDKFLNHADIIVVTNVFGHLQKLTDLVNFAKANKKYLVFDNAATPYSFYEGQNSCNLPDASFISLHHTKPIGFGEGGLAIIKKEWSEVFKSVINFGWNDGMFNERGSNFKMSELSAAGVLQYWRQFDIDRMMKSYLDNYYDLLYDLKQKVNVTQYQNYGEMDKFLPACLPVLFEEDVNISDKIEVKQYYKPLVEKPVCSLIYNRIRCFPVHERIKNI